MAELQYRIFGREHGDFKESIQSLENFSEGVRKILPSSIRNIFVPRSGFTNRITNNYIYVTEDDYLLRTYNLADGGLIFGQDKAVAFLNGDCPVICLYDGLELAVLHAGYRCLIREDKEEEGIIEAGLRFFNLETVKVFIFGGIGPCCWEVEVDNSCPKLENTKVCRYYSLLWDCISRTTRSSSKSLTVDLYELALKILLANDVPLKNISWDTTCTCCAMKNGEPTYWSHTRFRNGHQEVDGRNLAMAWLV